MNLNVFVYDKKVESPSESKMNRLGMYLLMSLLLVFGTMLEFVMVLIIKQKLDQSKKSIEENDKLFLENEEKFGENIKKASVSETVDQHVTPNLKTHILTFSKDMPSYRKIDIVAFFFFSGYFLCFSFVYFIVCIYN